MSFTGSYLLLLVCEPLETLPVRVYWGNWFLLAIIGPNWSANTWNGFFRL